MPAPTAAAPGRRRRRPRARRGGSRVPQGDYLRDPAAIYRASFAAIRREAAIDRLPPAMQPVALRLIHACAMPDILADLAWTEGAVSAGRGRWRRAGRCSWIRPWSKPASAGSACLPAMRSCAGCTMPATATLAAARSTTRAAAAVDLWQRRSRRGDRRDRQCPDRAVPSSRGAGGRRAGARPGARLRGRLRGRGRGEGGLDRPSA